MSNKNFDSSSERFFRSRPHWYALVFHYGLGIVVLWQFLEDLHMGQWKIYSGDFAAWRMRYDYAQHWGFNPYWYFASAEAILLTLYFLRVRLGITALLLSFVLFADNLGSFLNHRLLMSIELFLYSFYPVQKFSTLADYRKKDVYWNLDLIRFQIGVVYVVTVIHKWNPQFLSGQTLQNLFWMLQNHGMKNYPEALYQLLIDPRVCFILAWITIVSELTIGLFMHNRKVAKWIIAMAIGLHMNIALLMPYIWIFTVQIFIALIAFLPDRTCDGEYILTHREGRTPRFLRFVWPGYICLKEDDTLARNWTLTFPNGEETQGYLAFVELLSLSPLTFIFAEPLRIPTRYAVK